MSGFEWPPLPEWFWYAVTFLYGAIVGSFLNVVIYRLPLISFRSPGEKPAPGEPQTLSKPPSTCPNCHYTLTFWDNIPLLSFLGLRARCRLCRQPISWRYFCVELITACLWTLLYHQVVDDTGISWVSYVFQALFLSVLIALIFIDLDHFIAPDELNILAAILGIGRDLACLALAYFSGGAVWDTFRDRFTYFHWLPTGIVGALAYGGLLLGISVLGFLYYAREPGESTLSALRRCFSEDAPPVPEPEASAVAEIAPEPEADEPEVEEEEGESPRLAFSPAFLCAISALAMLPLVRWWAPLFFVVPLLAFLVIARQGESLGATARRFFRSDDLGLPGSASSEVEQSQAEADQFVKEAETGQHGGMGLGDVKLAIGIGGLLGPGLAILSLGFATLFGAVTGITLAKMHRRSLRLSLPFVPFMAAGALLTMLYGPVMLGWYGRFLNPEAPRLVSPGEELRDRKAKERAEQRRLQPGPGAIRRGAAPTPGRPATLPDPTRTAPDSR